MSDATQYDYSPLRLYDLQEPPKLVTRLWINGKQVAQTDATLPEAAPSPEYGEDVAVVGFKPYMPEHFYVVDGADWADFTISWTELPGVKSTPMSIARIIDAAMTRDFIEHGPAPQVAAPLPVFAPKRAKPALAGLMVEADGKASGIGFCAGE